MEYNLNVNKETKSIIIENNEVDSFLAKVDKNNFHVTHRKINDHTVHIEIDSEKRHKGVNIYIADTANGKTISIDGITYTVSDADTLFLNSAGKEITTGIPDKITPPMPATVISVMVNKDDTVKKGDAIVVISAMKMETTLAAPYDGRITSVNVSEGTKVMPGDILVDIEPES
ncbi:MAG: acetyl-CoA carboxylase biotin carboxyl carrier protein subunit [Deltaproteobacteria bacterium]|nr:acetyl-CoA carboxylase biotin carboxyl carrier protein subunit [Deltaproteobacteria bacterium]